MLKKHARHDSYDCAKKSLYKRFIPFRVSGRGILKVVQLEQGMIFYFLSIERYSSSSGN